MQALILFLTFAVLINLNNDKKNQLVDNIPQFGYACIWKCI